MRPIGSQRASLMSDSSNQYAPSHGGLPVHLPPITSHNTIAHDRSGTHSNNYILKPTLVQPNYVTSDVDDGAGRNMLDDQSINQVLDGIRRSQANVEVNEVFALSGDEAVRLLQARHSVSKINRTTTMPVENKPSDSRSGLRQTSLVQVGQRSIGVKGILDDTRSQKSHGNTLHASQEYQGQRSNEFAHRTNPNSSTRLMFQHNPIQINDHTGIRLPEEEKAQEPNISQPPLHYYTEMEGQAPVRVKK